MGLVDEVDEVDGVDEADVMDGRIYWWAYGFIGGGAVLLALLNLTLR